MNSPLLPNLLQRLPHNRLAVATLLTALAALIFWPVLLAGGFFGDDHILLYGNPQVKNAAGLYDIWFSTNNPDYFPVMSSTFWLEWRIWGNWPQGFHATNVLLHILSAYLLYAIGRHLQWSFALPAAILFLIHPVNVESVAWIAQRKNSLSMALMCASTLLYLRAFSPHQTRWKLYLAALACFLAALLSKTAVVMLPVVLLLLAWHQNRRITRADLLRTAPFFLLSLILGLVTIWFQMNRAITDVIIREDSLPTRLWAAAAAIWFYLGKLVFPVALTFNYPRWQIENWGLLQYLPALALAALLATLYALRKTPARHFLAALLMYIAMLLPVLGFVNIYFMRYSLVSDHWQYHATPMILTWLAGSLAWLWQHARPQLQPTLAALASAVAIALVAYSMWLANVYRTAENVMVHTVSRTPSAWFAHINLGTIYLEQARSDSRKLPLAIHHLETVTRLRPSTSAGFTNLGNAYLTAGRVDDAIRAYEKSLAATDTNALEKSTLHTNVGTIFAMQKKFPEAESHLRQAIAIRPRLAAAHYNLGLVFNATARSAEAQSEWKLAADIDPEYVQPRLQLARAAMAQDDLAQARKWADEILKIQPQNRDALAIRTQSETPLPKN